MKTQVVPKYVSVKRAVEIAGIGRTRLYELAKAGRLPIKKVGRSSLVPVDALLAIIETAPDFRSGSTQMPIPHRLRQAA